MGDDNKEITNLNDDILPLHDNITSENLNRLKNNRLEKLKMEHRMLEDDQSSLSPNPEDTKKFFESPQNNSDKSNNGSDKNVNGNNNVNNNKEQNNDNNSDEN